MKNLIDVWKAVKTGTTVMKENYYATILNVGANGISKFKVTEDDLKKEFKGPLINLVASKENQDVQYDSMIKIYEKGVGLGKRPKYSILISHEQDSDTVEFTLIGGKKDLLGNEIDPNKTYYYEIPKGGMLLLKCWDDVLSGFKEHAQEK